MESSRQRTDHIAKVMRLDPRKEWLASKLYANTSSWCNCREDHDINPPCGTVRRARQQIDMLLIEALSVGLITEVTPYAIPPEPKYPWEEDTLEDLMEDVEEWTKFIRGMDTKEYRAFMKWQKGQK